MKARSIVWRPLIVARCSRSPSRDAARSRTPAAAGAGGAEKKSGPLRLAVVPKAVGFDFWNQVKTGAECAASKQKDVEVQWDGVTAETDVTGQVNLLQNFITQGVDGLVYAATDAKVLGEVTKQARSRTSRWSTSTRAPTRSRRTSRVFATDNVASAEKVAGLMAEKLGKRAARSRSSRSSAVRRPTSSAPRASRRASSEHPELELVAEQASQSDYDKALQVTEDILTANPNLKGIFAANEPSVLGAAEAVRQAGKSGKIMIVGWDASPDEVKGVRDGVIGALIVQNPFRMGYNGVNAIARQLREGDQARERGHRRHDRDEGQPRRREGEGGARSRAAPTRRADGHDLSSRHAASCARPPAGKSGGSSWSHGSKRFGQRGWKRQPVGTSAASGSSPPSGVRAARRHRVDERLRVGMPRALDDVARVALLDDPSEVHDRDAVAQLPRQAEVVGDEQQRELARPLQLEQHLQDLRAHRDVEHRHRLVADDPGGLEHEVAAIATRWRWPPESWCG